MRIAIIAVSKQHFNEVYNDFVIPSKRVEGNVNELFRRDIDGNEYYYVDYLGGMNGLMGRSVDKIIDMNPVSINTTFRFNDVTTAIYIKLVVWNFITNAGRNIMVKEIVKDLEFLTKRSENSIIREDRELYRDLIETAEAHKEECVGLSAVQIGVHKRAIAVLFGDKFMVMVNPMIVQRSSETYEAEEGCLSLEGTRKTIRNRDIMLFYTTTNGKSKKAKFSGLTAQIIQHEVDHCNGILI